MAAKSCGVTRRFISQASRAARRPVSCAPHLVARSSAGSVVTVVHEAAADVIGRGKGATAGNSARLARVHGAVVAVHGNLHPVPVFVHVVAVAVSVPVSVSWMRVQPVGE